MILKKTFSIIAICMLLLTACKNDPKKEDVVTKHGALKMETFSELPNEIEGCGCYFATDAAAFKAKHYIFVNDYAETSFLNINGEKTMFSQTDLENVTNKTVKTTAKSNAYTMVIEITDGDKIGDEKHLKTGNITLTDADGQTITTSFYGECGC